MFCGMFVLDLLWAWYTNAVAAKHIGAATIASGFIYLVGGYVTVQYVQDPTLLIPATAGAMLGTYVAVYCQHAEKNDG